VSQEGGRDDAELDAFLGRSSDLQRRWRAASQEEPPPPLDDKVRAAARRAAGAGPRALHTPFSTRWRVPLSIAAVIVVSATVTLMVADRSEHLPGTHSEDLRTTAPAAQPPAPPSEEESSAGSGSESTPSSADAPTTAPAVTPAAPRRRALEDAVRKQEEVRQHAPDPPREADSAAAPAPVPPPAATSADAARDREAAPSARMQENGAMQRQAAPERGDSAFDASKATPSRAAGGVRAMPQAPAAATPGAAGEPARAEAKRESSEQIEQSWARASGVEQTTADAAREAPQRWIERIRALRRAGKSAEAEESLREFRRQYPDYPLPEDLQPPR
jgi:hypothetical protein